MLGVQFLFAVAVASEGTRVERDAEDRRTGDWEVAAAATIDWSFTTEDAHQAHRFRARNSRPTDHEAVIGVCARLELCRVPAAGSSPRPFSPIPLAGRAPRCRSRMG